MKIIAFIEEPDVIRKILVNLNLRDIRNHDLPAAKYTHVLELTYVDSYAQPSFDYVWVQ